MSRYFENVTLNQNLFMFNENGYLGITGTQGFFSLGSSPLNTYFVAKNGNDSSGNGTITNPYLTITKALTVASGTNGAGVWVMPGTYNESITLPDNVTLRGQSLRTVTISKTNVTANTTLVTMGLNSRLEDVTLNLSSTGHYSLIGIDFPGDTAFQAKVATIVCSVDNRTASPTGSSNVYAVNFSSNATNIPEDFVQQLIRNSMVVRSIGGGNKRVVNITGFNRLSFRDMNVYCYDYGATGNATGTYYGVYQNNATGTVNIKNSSVFGGSIYNVSGATGTPYQYADIYQNTGTIILTATDLVSGNAGERTFETSIASSNVFFGFSDQLKTADRDKYLFPGVVNKVTTVPVGFITNNKKVVFKLSVTCITGPVGGTDTFTVYRNEVATQLKVDLPAGSTTAQSDGIGFSSTFKKNDILSIKYTSNASPGSTDPVIDVSLY